MVWLLAEDQRMEIALRIRRDLLTKPASAICRTHCRGHSVPRRRAVSQGQWSPSRGQRPLARQHRHQYRVRISCSLPWSNMVHVQWGSFAPTPTGTRILTYDERLPSGKVRVVRNDVEDQTRAPMHFEPICSPEDDARLNAVLNKRGSTQNDKPRFRRIPRETRSVAAYLTSVAGRCTESLLTTAVSGTPARLTATKSARTIMWTDRRRRDSQSSRSGHSLARRSGILSGHIAGMRRPRTWRWGCRCRPATAQQQQAEVNKHARQSSGTWHSRIRRRSSPQSLPSSSDWVRRLPHRGAHL